ncbi:MAG: hypothetical protein M3P51_10500 [Chloroflexota bacterium]|nr:hypothetical protein [Chloroflexota bacterium]
MDNPKDKIIRQLQETIRQRQEVLLRQQGVIEQLQAKVAQLERQKGQVESGSSKPKGIPSNKLPGVEVAKLSQAAKWLTASANT